MLQFLVTLLPLLTLVPGVFSHGYVKSHTLNGLTYTGFLPASKPDFTLPAPNVVRQIPGDGPITNPALRNITCNEWAVPLPGRYATITAGTQIKFQWNGFTHLGPMLTYMARCKNDDCGTFWGDDRDGLNSWFKIDHSGYDNTTEYWATTVLYQQKNAWYSTVPACITPGNYLIRHEAISVSGAYQVGGAQFYPSCIQVTVQGTGTVNPTGYSIQEIYKPTGPGILFNTNLPYTYYPLPGPPVFTCPT